MIRLKRLRLENFVFISADIFLSFPFSFFLFLRWFWQVSNAIGYKLSNFPECQVAILWQKLNSMKPYFD